MAPAAPAIITLTTDFGLRDSYVAEMKAAILGVTRHVQLIDVTHEVPAHDVMEGALTLEAAAPRFPPGAVHLAVVDPGVGTARRGLALAWRNWMFVGPDNGLFTPFLGEDWKAVELTASEYRRPAVSPTFHGRDVFAPAAAHLACGVDLGRLGPTVGDPIRIDWPDARETLDGIEGTVVLVDRFGNLVTSVREEAVAGAPTGTLIRIAGRELLLVRTYADLPRGAPGALIGSRGRLEIAVREGRAEVLLGAAKGAPVLLRTSRSTRIR